MKKAYSKPIIVFESFQISQSIAAGCALGTENPIDVGGVTIFTSGCDTQPQDGVDYNICYHVPVADQNVFTS